MAGIYHTDHQEFLIMVVVSIDQPDHKFSF